MDKDKPPPVARTVEEVLEDFWWRRRALTDKEQREVRSPVSSQASNGSILNSESEDEDEDEDNDGDDEEDEDDDEMEEDEEEHEEIETKNENADLMDEDEEESGKAFCRACGNNDGDDGFWICCDICKKRFHGNCVKFTPALEEDQKECPLCRART